MVAARLCLCSTLALAALVGPSAHAAGTADAAARARSHFEAGKALYELGRFSEARNEFAAGYELSKEPRLLLDLGQCYRKLDEAAKARDMYQLYLQTSGDDEYRAQVEKVIAELERQLRENPPPAERAETPIGATPLLPPPLPKQAKSIDLTVHHEAPPARPSFARRAWWLFPLLAVVAAGAAVGLYFLFRPVPPDCGAASLGCVYPPAP